MDRKIMINEVVAAKREMFSDNPHGKFFTHKYVSQYNTPRLEKLHRKTMEDYRVWSLNEEERNRSATLLKDHGPDTLLAVQAGLLPEEEKKMEKNKSKKKEAPTKFVADDRSAFEALAIACWEEDDRPDISEMTEDQVSQELKESLSLLAPEDKETIIALENGAANWDYLEALMKDQAEEKVSTKKEEKTKAKKEKKEKAPKKESGPTRLECVVMVLKEGCEKKDLCKKSNSLYTENGGKDNEKEQKSDVTRALQVLKAAGLLKEDNGILSI